jgi:hypothetical protein
MKNGARYATEETVPDSFTRLLAFGPPLIKSSD